MECPLQGGSTVCIYLLRIEMFQRTFYGKIRWREGSVIRTSYLYT